MGFACKLSPKQAAANLAMALTLAADTKHLSAMTKEYLEFMTMCMTAGLDIDLNIDNYPDTLIPAKSCDHDLDVGNPLMMQSLVISRIGGRAPSADYKTTGITGSLMPKTARGPPLCIVTP